MMAMNEFGKGSGDHQHRESDQNLDLLLRRAGCPAPPARLVKAVVALPGKHKKSGGFWGFVEIWRPAGFALGAVLMGFFLGQATTPPKRTTMDSAKIDRFLSSLVLSSDFDFSEFER